MKKLLIIFPLLFFCVAARAEIIPENPPNHFALLFELRDGNSLKFVWTIVILPSKGMTILVENMPLPIQKISDQEIISFWKLAREVFDSFKFEQDNNDHGKFLLSVNFEVDKERIVIEQKVGDLSRESESVRNLIELCNSYLPEKNRFK